MTSRDNGIQVPLNRQLIITGIETGNERNETKRNETEVTSTVPHLTAIGFSYTAYTPQCIS